MIEPLAWIAENTDDFVAWLTAQRWYGDKSRTLASVETDALSRVEVDGGVVWLLEAVCRFERGDDTRYLVPLATGEDLSIQDAMALPAFRSWLARGFADGRELEATARPGARLSWEAAPGGDAQRWTSGPGTILSGEQSNTSVIYDEVAILKLFRRLQPGVNPDSEIVAFLTSRTEFRHVPAYLGSLWLQSGDGRQPVELGAVQAFVANDGDCWRWLPAALASNEEGNRQDLLKPVALLGQRTGELHGALAVADDLDAFKPEPFTGDAVGAERTRLLGELSSTVSAIRRLDTLSDEQCNELEAALQDRLSLAGVLEGLPRIRVHGDYHLGQVLRTGDDFVIIDFEGEPSRTMTERRQKHSPLKDAAGMLRSLDYAVSTARRSLHDAEGAGLDSWRTAAERAFLDAYREAVRRAAIDLVPSDNMAFLQALDVYTIEKALYETRYELDNRPDWVDIPLEGLRRIGFRT